MKTKKEIREKYLNIRRKVNESEKKDNIITEKVINNLHVKDSEIILIYVSYNNEVNTFDLINYFLKSKKVAVPKIEKDTMKFYYINGLDDLRKSKYGILEPITRIETKDFTKAICITPGVCFSKDRYRIGYGKGYYDRFFSNHLVYSIGLCYKECLIDNIPTDEYDKQVDEIITD